MFYLFLFVICNLDFGILQDKYIITNMSAKKSEIKGKSSTTIARSDDGTIQITFTIPVKTIDKTQEDVLTELAKTVQVPGFRLGHAPLPKVKENVSQNSLLEKTLSKILPKLVSEAVEKHKIKPAIYPKFELVKTTPGENWQVRAVTCEVPEIELGDYKKAITSLTLDKKSQIWTPKSAKSNKDKADKSLTQQEIQSLVNG